MVIHVGHLRQEANHPVYRNVLSDLQLSPKCSNLYFTCTLTEAHYALTFLLHTL